MWWATRYYVYRKNSIALGGRKSILKEIAIGLLMSGYENNCNKYGANW